VSLNNTVRQGEVTNETRRATQRGSDDGGEMSMMPRPMNLRDKSFAADKRNLAIAELLARARALARDAQTFHLQTYTMSECEKIADTGAIAAEIDFCRNYIERSDRLQADIDRFTTNEGTRP